MVGENYEIYWSPESNPSNVNVSRNVNYNAMLPWNWITLFNLPYYIQFNFLFQFTIKIRGPEWRFEEGVPHLVSYKRLGTCPLPLPLLLQPCCGQQKHRGIVVTLCDPRRLWVTFKKYIGKRGCKYADKWVLFSCFDKYALTKCHGRNWVYFISLVPPTPPLVKRTLTPARLIIIIIIISPYN